MKKLITALSPLFLLAACSNPPSTPDADVVALDAADEQAVESDAGPDVVLPPGPRGDILRVPEERAFVIPTLGTDVNVVYTEGRVPHVYAANPRDVYVVQGFLLGRDRYFQVELQRRVGLGTASELLGQAGMTLDTQSRGRGYRVIADRLFAQMGPEERDALRAYAEGFNAYVGLVRSRRMLAPPEIRVIALVVDQAATPWELMQPITDRDLAAVLALVLANSSFTTDDLQRARASDLFAGLYSALPAGSSVSSTDAAMRRGLVRSEIFERVKPLTDVTSALGLGTDSRAGVMATRRPSRRVRRGYRAPAVATEMLDRLIAATAPLEALRRGGRTEEYGSNAWALSGRGTADGSALLAGDGHLPLSVPTLLYQMHTDTTVFSETPTTGQSLMGLFFPGIPWLAVGTNGRVAYSFTYLYGDLTDWYADRVELDATGKPRCAVFQGTCRDLVATNESYVIANVPSLGSMGRTEMWTRWVTVDGRYLASVEGDVAMPGVTPPAGRSVIDVLGQRIIPRDVNGDGYVSAVTFDYTGFDVSNVPGGLRDFERANTVRDLRNAQRRFVAFAQNFVGADSTGAVHYSGYTGTPCRSNLTREGAPGSERFAPGADPRLLLDGTRFPGFTIPLNAMGLVDEDAGRTDPTRCVVPFANWPQSLDPERGYTLTANNDLGGTSMDNNLANGTYLGGPWAVGYRAQTIRDELARNVTQRNGTIESMANLQGSHRSPLAAVFIPAVVSAVARAREVLGGAAAANDGETRASTLYGADRAAIDQALGRLQAWLTRGHVAESGVETFYHTPTADQRADAAATMIFNQFYRTLMAQTLGDEGIDEILDTDSRFLRGVTMVELLRNRRSNPSMLASYDAARGESLFWDDVRTPVVERSDELIVKALATSLTTLRMPASAPGEGGFGTADQSQWLWGLRHQVALESIITAYAGGSIMGIEPLTAAQTINTRRLPLAPMLMPSDPRANLTWFPRPGDLYNVDASNPPSGGSSYVYRSGPVMRMVIELKDGRVRGQNVIPAGQSGQNNTNFFDDQARLWLGNRTLPLRYTVPEVTTNATGRERFSPR
ncbi:MAG: penicillin acylase family protein [Deltaproteobacteria bacterium]|nr:penicillin acylase family protein [Deltaproteobacteria bacterium]